MSETNKYYSFVKQVTQKLLAVKFHRIINWIIVLDPVFLYFIAIYLMAKYEQQP